MLTMMLIAVQHVEHGDVGRTYNEKGVRNESYGNMIPGSIKRYIVDSAKK